MTNRKKDITEYKDKIIDISIAKIERNHLNPRKRFVDSEEDVLIESILSKGLLNPIIVYKIKSKDKYVILDGERRFRAYKRLNYKTIACHVLENEPNNLDNLSMMFHIHNVREEWTDFSIAQTLVKVIYEMGNTDIKKLTRKDKLEISKLTSLSEYRINKYLIFYDYPNSVIDKFMKSELKEIPDKGVDPDILAEMHRPIKKIENLLPEFLKKYSVPKIIDSIIKKKSHDVIKTNRELRLLTKSLEATEKNKVRKSVMFDKLENFINILSITPLSIFEETAETTFMLESIILKSEKLSEEILNINLNELTNIEKIELKDKMKEMLLIVKNKLNF